MAINKYVLTALKTLSTVEVDIKTNYKRLRQLERIAKKPRLKPVYQAWEHQLIYDGHWVPVRVFSPLYEKIKGFTDLQCPVIIFFHGGGWVTGELETYENTCLTIARQTGYLVVAVDYRLAPENPFPAAINDCYHAVKAVMQWPQALNAPQNVILMGDSAGGNLAAVVSLLLRDKVEPAAGKQVLLYPVTYNDHTATSPFKSVIENGKDYLLTSKRICDYMDLYYCESERNNPYLAPLLAEDLSNQPDTLIITAQYDPLRDEAEEYGRRLRESGNRVIVHRMADVMHGYFSLSTRYSAVKDTYKIINQFLQG